MKDILRVVMGEDGRKKSRGVMPIIGWVNPSVNTYMTAAADRKRVSHEELYRRYEEYRGAGFNMVFCMGTAVGASDDGLVEEILEICDKLELGCLLIDAQTYSRPFTEKRLQELYDFASKYASFKGLMVYDEPNVSAFPTLAQNYVMFRKYFPDKLFYVNLLPNYATDEQLGTDNYAKYVAEYAKMVKQGYLSYDHYPFIHFEIGIVNNDKYFKNLSVIRRQSLQSRVPFMVFVEVTAFVSHAHIPNREEIFWQVNTALAYGARGIQYFTYGMPEDTSETFSGAVIARDGTRTASYDAVREINAHLAEVSGILARCRNTGVIFTGIAPMNEFGKTITIPREDLITSYGRLSYVRSGNVLTGCFDCEGSEVYYVANNDFCNYSEVELEFSQSVVLRMRRGGKKREVIVDRIFRLILNAGEGVLLQIK